MSYFIKVIDEAGNVSRIDCQGTNQASIRFDQARRNANAWGTRHLALLDDDGRVVERWTSPRWLKWVGNLPADRREAYRAQIEQEYGAAFPVPALHQARDEYVRTFCADVAAFPNAYKKRVVEAPDVAALAVIEGLDEADVRRMTRELRAEMRTVAKAQKA